MMRLKKTSEGMWVTNDGKVHKVKGIKIIKDEVYFYKMFREICINYIEPRGYKVEIISD